jgi:predicted nucleotidyltransferase component of viral defense system
MDLSEKTGFHKDILEKVHRLVLILDYINSNQDTAKHLVLKGGTAINLTVFSLPRLSVDIDLDFCASVTREEMLLKRNDINKILFKLFEVEGYNLMPKSKTPHSLDSWVIGYTNTSGNRDKIKVEINYSLREHVMPIENRTIATDIFKVNRKVNTIAITELYASKIVALLNRTTARDLYDIHNFIIHEIAGREQYDLLRKMIIFYKSITDDKIEFDFSVLDKLTPYNIKTQLLPLLRKKEGFDVESVKEQVKTFLQLVMVISDKEKEYVDRFLKGEYRPELLFEENYIPNIKNHPMAIWKTVNNAK